MRVEQRIVEGIEIAMWHRLGETGRVHQDVGTSKHAAHVIGGLSHCCRIFEHDAHGAMTVAGQLRDNRMRAIIAFVVADDDARALLGQHAYGGAPMPLQPPVTTATLPRSCC